MLALLGIVLVVVGCPTCVGLDAKHLSPANETQKPENAPSFTDPSVGIAVAAGEKSSGRPCGYL